MALKISSQPAIEPLSLTEAAAHLRLDPDSFADQVTSVISIAPGVHVIAAAYSLKGTGVSVAGKEALVIFSSGTNLATGTVDVKIQESDTDVDGNYTDWATGAFTQVTTANDNATYEKTYTGTKTYIRVVATVANASCEFGVSIETNEPTIADSTLIQSYIKAAREYCEGFQNRAYINRTYEWWLDCFPSGNKIVLPMPPLIAVSSLKYYSTADVETSDTTLTDYYQDVKNEPGALCLNYGEVWPTTTLRPTNGVCVTYTAGYGATAASTPEAVRNAMRLLIGDYYAFREAGKASEKTIEAVERLLWLERVM